MRPRTRAGANHHFDLRHPRPLGRPPGHGCAGGVRGAHAHPGRRHPARPRRPRPPRRRPDRHRQDRRLRAAHPRAPSPRRQHGLLAGPPPGPRPRPHADARAGHAGRRVVPDVRPDTAAPLGRRATAACRSTRRSRRSGRASRSSSRRRAACSTTSASGKREPRPGRDPRPRRGRPHARHGLHPRHPPIVAMLPARRQQTLLFSATFSDEIRRLAQEFLRNPATVEVAPRNTTADNLIAGALPGGPRPQGRPAGAPDPARPDGAGARLHPDEDRPPSRLAGHLDRRGVNAAAIHGDRSQPERTRALEDFKRGDVTVPRRNRRRLARARHRGAPVRRQLRAAATSRRTTSTGSAAPGAPARAASRSRWSRPTRSTSCAASSACCGRPSPSRWSRRSCPAPPESDERRPRVDRARAAAHPTTAPRSGAGARTRVQRAQRTPPMARAGRGGDQTADTAGRSLTRRLAG